MPIGRYIKRTVHGVVAVSVALLVACTGSEPSDDNDRPAEGQDRGPPVGKLPQNGPSPGRGGPRDEPVAMDAALETASLHPDGSVTGSGYLVCTPGETMNVGFAIWNVRSDRESGMVRTGEDRLYFECTGERQEWTLRGSQVLGGGIEAGPHPYNVKTAVGTGSRHDHRDYFRGTIVVEGP